jgi:hypothetical protein
MRGYTTLHETARQYSSAPTVQDETMRLCGEPPLLPTPYSPLPPYPRLPQAASPLTLSRSSAGRPTSVLKMP